MPARFVAAVRAQQPHAEPGYLLAAAMAETWERVRPGLRSAIDGRYGGPDDRLWV